MFKIYSKLENTLNKQFNQVCAFVSNNAPSDAEQLKIDEDYHRYQKSKLQIEKFGAHNLQTKVSFCETMYQLKCGYKESIKINNLQNQYYV